MLLQLAASYSYDSIIFGLMFLFTAKLISVFYSDKKVTKKQMVLFALLSIAIAISKYVYAPVILCLLVIPSDKLDVKNPKRLKGIIIISIIVCAVAAIAILQNSISVLDYLVPSYSTAKDQSLFTIIVGYISMFAMTAIEIMDFYIRSLVAYPGWYQIYVPTSIISAYYLLLIFSTVRNKDDKQFLSPGTRIWFVIFMGMSCILMTFPMAAKFTNPGSETIDGIQGRYFLPLVPLFCLGFRMKLVNADSAFFKKILWGGAYISFLFFGFCFLDLFSAI
jgi:Predicted membrane protein